MSSRRLTVYSSFLAILVVGIADAQPVPRPGVSHVSGGGALLGEDIAVRCLNAAGNAFIDCGIGGAGATDADDGSVAGGQTAGLSIGLTYVWSGTAWVRAPGDSTGVTIKATDLDIRNLTSASDSVAAVQSGTWTVQQGTPPWTIRPDGTVWTLTGTSANVAITNTPTVTVGTFPDNEPFNLNQIVGSAVSTAATGVQKVGVVGNAGAAFDAASAAAPPANRIAIGGLTSGATAGLMASPTICDSFVNVNVVTATTVLLVTGVSGRHVRICGLSLLTAGANNVALISGTGATCGTGTTGMTGGTTAATGYNFAANGGIAQGAGVGEINRTNATGDSVCIVTSAAVQLSGRISYAIY